MIQIDPPYHELPRTSRSGIEKTSYVVEVISAGHIELRQIGGHIRCHVLPRAPDS
jgi:hypothetical protein